MSLFYSEKLFATIKCENRINLVFFISNYKGFFSE